MAHALAPGEPVHTAMHAVVRLPRGGGFAPAAAAKAARRLLRPLPTVPLLRCAHQKLIEETVTSMKMDSRKRSAVNAIAKVKGAQLL